MQPLTTFIRYLSHSYSVVPVVANLSLATAQTIQVRLGNVFSKFENVQRLLLWWSDLGQSTAGA